MEIDLDGDSTVDEIRGPDTTQTNSIGASITSPTYDSVLGGEIPIRGTATGDDFQQYSVEYGVGETPTSWTEIATSTTPVSDGVLATWNTTAIESGVYTVRLTVDDTLGNAAYARTKVIVDNAAPTTTLAEYPQSVIEGNLPKVDVSFSWEGSDDITPTENLLYQYKLEGYPDYENWSSWLSETSKTYTLSSGNYTFKVRAKDEVGNYPEENDPATATYSFTVSLPIIVYPNPCYPGKGQIITITNLPLNSKVYIYTISGELVRELNDVTEITEEGGSATATWDLRNDAGNMVAQGVYIYLIPEATGDRRTGKIAIIK